MRGKILTILSRISEFTGGPITNLEEVKFPKKENTLIAESYLEIKSYLEINAEGLLELLKRNLKRWTIHLESTKHDEREKRAVHENMNNFISTQNTELS